MKNTSTWIIHIFLIVTGCADIDVARTPQQLNLDNKAFEILSEQYDDTIYDDTSYDDKYEYSAPINEKFYKPISITATESVPLKEVLTQMASIAGVNIFIAPDVDGSASFSATNRPFLDILEDICSLNELRHTITGNSVKIDRDIAILKVYNLQFLNVQRETSNSVSISTDIFNQNSSDTQNLQNITNSANTNNGSSSLITGIVKNDFWGELESTLKSIVGNDNDSYVSIHKQGGLVTINAPQRKQNEIQKYLKLLKELSEEQVLIEAKILEVNLNDEFKSGINWNILRSGGTTIHKDFSDRTGLFSMGIDRANLNIVTGLIEKFGAVKTLSSPRITVLNNQSAILKVAQNEIIYMPELQKQYATVADSRSTDFLSTSIHTIPIGLVMSVQPSIDKKNNSVVLNLRPTISKIVKYKKVPFFYQSTVPSGSSSNSSTSNIQTQDIPVVDVREFDSVLKLNSGQIVVMGGLMHEKSNNLRDGLPSLPKIDFATGSREKTTEVTELVIFLKATILHKKSQLHHKADQKVYETFAKDPRPFRFKHDEIKK